MIQRGERLKKKNLIIICMIVLVAGLTLFGMSVTKKDSEEKKGLLEVIENYKGYSRTVSKEEYDFYSYFVERDLPEKVSAEEFDHLVKAYANEVNAVFYLANRIGFCEPYSFEVLEMRMQQENTKRQIQLEEGEVIYGLEQFTLETYFQYTLDNLQASLQGYLEEYADEEIMNLAKEYYQTHEEEFIYRKEVVYEQTVDGVTETLTADVDMLSFLGKSDTGLADFLGIAQVGDTYADDCNDQDRRVTLKEITYSEKGFENNGQMALYLLIREELYEEVINMVAENNPLEFETN